MTLLRKPFLILVILTGFCLHGFSQTTFYYAGTGDLATITNWGTNTDGTGTTPTDFTSNDQIFEIRNTTSVSLTSDWTVSGTGSLVVLGNSGQAAVTLTHSDAVDFNATIDIAAASSGSNTLMLQQTDANTPTLGTLNSGSTVHYNRAGAQTVQQVTYGNLSISNSGSKTAAGALSINSGLIIGLGATLDMSTHALSSFTTLNGNGLIQTQNTSSTPLPTGRTWGAVDVEYNSTSAQTVVNGTYIDLTIGSSGTKTIGSGNVSVSGTFQNNGEFSIASNTLSVSGTFSGSGTITGSSTSNLTIGGAGSNATVNFTQTSSSTRSLNTFSMNRANGVTLGNVLELIGNATLSGGTLTTNGNLTLISTASATGRILALTGGATVSGDVTMQRFIPGGAGKRRYRYICPAVSVSGNYNLDQFIDDISITGSGTGYDQVQVSSSAFIYDEALSGGQNVGFTAPATTTTNIETGKGICVFVRGPRGQTDEFLSSTVPNNVTLDITGSINSGTISPGITYTNTGAPSDDGWNLVGNPYPCPISWTAAGWTRTNIDASMYVYNTNTGTYGVHNGTFGTNGVTAIIPSGQAFFIKANAASPVITFTETVKSSGNPFNLFRTNEEEANTIRIIFYKDSISSDEAVIHLSANSSGNYSEGEDALKLRNNVMNIFTKSDDQKNLAINSTLLSQQDDTIALAVTGQANNNYELRFNDLTYLDAGLTVYLKDDFTHDFIPILSGSTYPFAITSDPLSNSESRFTLIISQSAPLPIHLINFKAKENEKKVLLSWSSMEDHAKEYIIEKSKDAKNFELLDAVKASNSKHFSDYSIIDQEPYQGITYYKLSGYDANGFIFSRIISVSFLPNDEDHFSIYPNPAKDNICIKNIYHLNDESILQIIDASGRIVESEKINSGISVYSKNIKHLNAGVYLMQIIHSSGKINSFKINKN
jgi:hypothetical protein